MADIAVHYIVSRVAGRLSTALIQESVLLVGDVRSKFEWIVKELRYMQAFIQQLERSNSNQLEFFEDRIRSIALEVEDAIENFINASFKRRKKGVQYLLERYDVAKELEQITYRMGEISERIKNYQNEQTNIAVTVETPGPGVGVGATTIVSPALEKLDHILTQNLIILDGKVIEMVEHVRDEDLGDTQNIVISLRSTGELSQRAQVWLKEIEVICDYTAGVAEKFIAGRERRLRMRRLWQVLYLFEQYASEREFKKQMEYISTQLEDALYRRWTFGDGRKDMGDITGSRSRPVLASLSLGRLITAKVPFFILNGAFLPLLFLGIIITINLLMLASEPGTTERKPEEAKKKKRSRQLTTFLWFDLVDLMVFVLFYVLPVELMVFIQFGSLLYTIIAWIVSLVRCLDENLKTTRRYLALMRALFSDIESPDGLNERQKVWVEQLKAASQNGHSLLDAYPKDGFLFLIRRIRYARDMNDLLNEILDISDRKNIYGFANIQGRKKSVSTVQGSKSENIVEYCGPVEHPQPYASSSYRHITRLERKFQLINGERQLMNALSDDVPDITELEGRSKIWVEQMRGIASETEAVISKCAPELKHKPMLIYILRYPIRYSITAMINRIINKIEDASRRRNAYGLVQLQPRAESLPMVLTVPRGAKPFFVVKESRIVGFDEDINDLTAHLLSPEKRRCITSIVGIEGSGKTTLANLIFNSEAVIGAFRYKVWLSVDPSCTVEPGQLDKVVVTQIIGGQQHRWTTQGTTLDTILALRTLANTKYLIVVDGIRTSRVLHTLRETIPDMSTGSRFLVTTCNTNAAQEADTRCFVHPLRLLDDEQSWILFTRNLRVNIPPKLTLVGKKIVAQCGGLPLEILKMSDLLSNKDVTEKEWSSVLEQPNEGQNPWSEALNADNINLPSHLRCLFYFELFPPDFGIPVRRLVVLWVAEGLVYRGEDQEPPELVAKRYLTELIDLNLVQIAKRKPNGRVKTCRLPNALRGFSLIKAKESRFPQVHSSRESNAVPKSSRIRQVADHLDQKDIWYEHIHGNTTSDSVSLETYKDVFSFLSFDAREGSKPGQDINNFLNMCISSNCLLLLRVLDLEGVYKPKLPKNIARLTRLRYLGLRWTYLQSLPSSISTLLKLQTLDLKHTYIHTLISSIWNMELRHLFLSETYRTRFPPKPKGTANSLSDLQTLWGLFVDAETPVKGGLDKWSISENWE
ncbi:putative disease resistance RPP13 protein 2 [Spatholobus suberectus]|nr:putative disease resistance RPP13 protein 2 [Spatholobus suberectus]